MSLPVYRYDPDLTWQENNRRAMEAHEREGRAVAATFDNGVFSHWLFPTGATKGRRAEEAIREPDGERERRENVRAYWRVRAEVAESELRAAQKHAKDYPDMVTEDTVEKARSLAASVEACRAKEREADAKLAPPPEPDWVVRARARAEAKRSALVQQIATLGLSRSPE